MALANGLWRELGDFLLGEAHGFYGRVGIQLNGVCGLSKRPDGGWEEFLSLPPLPAPESEFSVIFAVNITSPWKGRGVSLLSPTYYLPTWKRRGMHNKENQIKWRGNCEICCFYSGAYAALNWRKKNMLFINLEKSRVHHQCFPVEAECIDIASGISTIDHLCCHLTMLPSSIRRRHWVMCVEGNT